MKTRERVRRTTLHLASTNWPTATASMAVRVASWTVLRLTLVGVPAGHSHSAVGEGHQHAALHDAAAVVMLRLARKT